MPKENDDSSMFIEIVQRLTKIEANTEGLSEISSIARNALSKSEENTRDITEIKENQKWTWRTIAGIGVSVVVYLFTRFMEGK
jgi:hypothetical protein